MYEWAAFQFTSKCDMGQYLTQCLSQPVVSHTKQLSEISAALTGLVTSSFSLTNFCFFAIGSSMKRFASAYSIRVIYNMLLLILASFICSLYIADVVHNDAKLLPVS